MRRILATPFEWLGLGLVFIGIVSLMAAEAIEGETYAIRRH